MGLGPKIIVLSTFACRIFVVVATVTRLVYLNRLKSSPDLFFDSIPYHICTQVQQAVSVIVASAPAVKKFMDRTNSGMLNASLWAHTGTTYGESQRRDTYLLTSISNRSRKSARHANKPPILSSKTDVPTSISDERHTTVPNSGTLFRPERIESEVMATGGHHRDGLGNDLSYSDTHKRPNGQNSRRGSDNEIDYEAESLESQRSDKMIINVQRHWKVTHYQSER